jgi:plastocyanin
MILPRVTALLRGVESMLKRFGMFAVTGALALMVLAACGSDDEDKAEPTVTRVPASNAPVVTATAAEAEEAAASPAAASPVAGSPVASESASPVASESASPVAAVTTTTDVATPVASTIASPTTAAPQASAEAQAPTAQEVDMVDINFDPKEITISANTDVMIKLANKGVTTHNFNIDALGIKSGDVASGAETTVTINAAPGTYDYYCAIPGHKEAGMVGKLIVK